MKGKLLLTAGAIAALCASPVLADEVEMLTQERGNVLWTLIALLDDSGGQVDPLGREHLDEGLGDDAAAVIAPGWAPVGEMTRLVDVDAEFKADGLGHLEQEEREERAGRPATDHRHPGAIFQGQGIDRRLTAEVGAGVPRSEEIRHRAPEARRRDPDGQNPWPASRRGQ